MKTVWISLLCLLLQIGCAQAAMSEEEFTRLLRSTLRNRPDIVLDLLREHSESILDIAQHGSNLRRKKNMESQWLEDIKQPKQVARDKRPELGPANAPVLLVAFSDFTCPYCQQAYESVKRLMEARPKELKLLFKHMPHGKDSPSRTGAEYFVAASLQSAQSAWRMYDIFFAQPEALSDNAAEFAAKTAEQLGLDMKRLNKDLKSKQVAAIIEEDLADAKALNFDGTPSFLINALRVRGAVSYDIFNAAVDMALAHSKK